MVGIVCDFWSFFLWLWNEPSLVHCVLTCEHSQVTASGPCGHLTWETDCHFWAWEKFSLLIKCLLFHFSLSLSVITVVMVSFCIAAMSSVSEYSVVPLEEEPVRSSPSSPGPNLVLSVSLLNIYISILSTDTAVQGHPHLSTRHTYTANSTSALAAGPF